jgi:hypothetical protein
MVSHILQTRSLLAADRKYVRLPQAAITKTTTKKKKNGYEERKKEKQCELDAYSI